MEMVQQCQLHPDPLQGASRAADGAEMEEWSSAPNASTAPVVSRESRILKHKDGSDWAVVSTVVQ